MEPMTFARQAGAAVFLVMLTLSIQCAGVAVLISWARASVERGNAHLSSLHAAVLMIRFSTLVIVLHFLQIFVWSVFYRWFVFHRGSRRSTSPTTAIPGSGMVMLCYPEYPAC